MSSKPRITTDIKAVIAELQSGRLVAIPTETVYGLAADASQTLAVGNVYDFKQRPRNHPLILHCATAEQAWHYVRNVPSQAIRLAATFWPGPLTMVLTCNDSIDPLVTGGQDSVAIRIPNHPLTLAVLQRLQQPIVAPSANRFGRVSPTEAQHVLDEFSHTELLILDGGPCQIGIESTIVDCRIGNQIKILRPGKITADDLFAVIGNQGVSSPTWSGDSPRVSGSLPAHYAPQASVILIEAGDWEDRIKQIDLSDRASMVISFSQSPDWVSIDVIWKSLSPELDEFAQKMYGYFREADQRGLKQIVVELPGATGIGIALRDRLQRAAFRQDDSLP